MTDSRREKKFKRRFKPWWAPQVAHQVKKENALFLKLGGPQVARQVNRKRFPVFT
jgi:hypothetical protein